MHEIIRGKTLSSTYQCFFFLRFDVRTNRPVLSAYMERIRQELNPHYDDVHEKVYQFRDAFKGEIPSKEEFAKLLGQDFNKQSE